MIQTFTTNTPGPHLVIMAGVHGNEPCGLEAFADVLPKLSITKGTVTFVIGNPKAVAVHRREYEANLNRMFRSDTDLSQAEKATYEYRRARELMPLLRNADALLDIHSSSTKDTVPFVICEPQSYACARVLPAAVVVSGIDVLHPTGTDAYVNQNGGLGICIECGYHDDNTAKDVAITAITNFLQFFEVVPKPDLKPNTAQTIIAANWIYRNQSQFTLSKAYEEFETIPQGAVIGTDGTTAVTAPSDGVILFPHNRTEPNTEAFLFGTIVH